MLTYEQYRWMQFIESGECTMKHRDEHPELFVELDRRRLIVYHTKRYHVTQAGKLEMQEARRAWDSDTKASRALVLSKISIVVAIFGLLVSLFR